MTALPRAYVKVCGVTSVADARQAADAGASAIGLNFWGQSPRCVSVATAVRIVDAVRGRLEIVAVTVDLEPDDLQQLVAQVGPDRVQLHGSESQALVRRAGPRAFKAVGLGGAADVGRALASPGVCVLVDAKDEVKKGGTGRAPPASLALEVCRARPTILAGGLGPDSVAAAIAAFAPAGVDAASGVESAPGKKDGRKLARYVEEARRAFAALGAAL